MLPQDQPSLLWNHTAVQCKLLFYSTLSWMVEWSCSLEWLLHVVGLDEKLVCARDGAKSENCENTKCCSSVSLVFLQSE
jgi:hypothetical protein